MEPCFDQLFSPTVSNIDYNRLSFTEAKWRIADFQAEIRLLGHFMQIRINYTIFRRPRGKETYCRDETDPILPTGVSDSVADYEIGEMAKWRMAAPGKTACSALPDQ